MHVNNNHEVPTCIYPTRQFWKVEVKWASSWDYGTYHLATSEGSDEPVHPCSLARAFAIRTHEVWKYKKDLTKNQTSRPTGWMCMRGWRTNLWRTKSAIISWAGSNMFWKGDPLEAKLPPNIESAELYRSHVMRFWHFYSSVNSFFKRACTAIQWG